MSALRLSVVGHVNTGKTSLVAALSRRADLEIGEGRTTTRVQDVEFRTREGTLLVLVDTPGFELADDIKQAIDRERVAAAEAGRPADDLELLRARIRDARAEGGSEILRANLDALEAACEADAILYVVDVMEKPVDKLRDEVALLTFTARPVVAVMNRTAAEGSHEQAWRELFRREKVPLQVAFDFWVADERTEGELLATIETALPPERRAALARLRNAREEEALRQRSASLRAIAELLLDAMTLRGSAPKSAEDAEEQAREDLRERVREREAEGFRAIGRAQGFSGDEIEAGARAPEAQLLATDLFAADTWKREAPGLLGLTAGGAAAGAAVDALVGGFSLGAGALIGGALGLVGGLTRRVLEVTRRGDRVEATLHPNFAWVLLARALRCRELYASRTHASRKKESAEAADRPVRDEAAAKRVVKLLHRAAREGETSDRRRDSALTELEQELAELLR